ncbi:MAG: metal ABC transporter permease [Eubacteriales bacterium]
MTTLETLIYYLSFPFVIRALIVGILVALCASLLGATLVLKRFSYIGDGLSHIAFGAMAIASVLNIVEQNLLIFPITALCAVLLLRLGQNAKVNGDAAIAMLSVGSLAIGYLLLNIFPVSANLSGDVCTTLFGSTSILTLTDSDVVTCIILSITVIIIFIVFYNKIFSITFDETFAKATGIKVELYNLLIAITIAAVIVVAMNLVGSLLISALVVFPALSSMRLFKNFRSVIISSVVISVLCALLGILVSIIYGTPVGSTIVTANIILFVITCLIARLKA